MNRNLSVVALLLTVSAGTAQAQSVLLRSATAPSPAPTPPVGASLYSEQARISLPMQQMGPSARPGPLVFGFMGALIGAGTGFLLSHVAHSDWEKENNSTFASHRRSFALSGAAVGAVSAIVVDRFSPRGNVLAGRSAGRAGAGGAITQEELAQLPVANALDAVRSLRPHWLQERGETLGSMGTIVGDASGAGPANVTTVPGEERIGAFLDGVRLADVNSIRDIPLNTVRRIEFRTGSVSASGPGHVQRAILVFTADGRSE